MAAPSSRSSRRYRRLAANLRAQHRPCCICGEPIDYRLEYPDPRSFSVQHLKSFSLFPHLREDPANLDAAHLDCNRGLPTSGRVPFEARPLGEGSRDW